MSNEYPYASMRDSFDLSAYFVVGPEDCKGRPLTDVVDQALHGGATFIQLRAKEADASELTDMARDIAQIIEDNEKSDSVAFSFGCILSFINSLNLFLAHSTAGIICRDHKSVLI